MTRRTRKTAERPRLVKIGAEMQRWCAQIEEELSDWPDVTSRPMFGMMAFYRGAAIFGAVPRTRAMTTPNSVMIKDDRPAKSPPGAGWSTFEIHSEQDIPKALDQFSRAYERARTKERARKRGPRRRPSARG